MAINKIQEVLREQRFSGNEAAFDALQNYIKGGKVIALTGAGVSVPLYPTWISLLTDTLRGLVEDGLVTDKGEIAEYEQMLLNDPLELADFLEQVRSEQIFRAKLANTFRKNKGGTTVAHNIMAKLNFRGIVTLNYDDGHEAAYAAAKGRNSNSGKAQDSATLARWTQDETFNDADTPILHLHGDLSDPKQMVITSSDYEKFYSQALPSVFVSQLWRTQRLLVIGFGFTDPFLTRIAENTLRLLQTDTRHFALIGKPQGAPVTSLTRRTFAKKFRLEPIFYEIRETTTASGGTSSDHSDLLVLLTALQQLGQAASTDVATAQSAPTTNTIYQAEREFKADLFVSPNNTTLYAQPRFSTTDDFTSADFDRQSVDTILDDSCSYIINCRPEFGATTVARRLAFEFASRGITALLRDANMLPNYKKKLLETFDHAGVSEGATSAVLILDNFEVVANERLLKEIIGTKRFSRVIALAKQTLFEVSTGALPVDHAGVPYKSLVLRPFHRADIRVLAEQFYQSNDTDLVSAIVEKVYGDLVNLCIPITPANTVMYLTILFKDGDFQPINKVQIVNRYLTNLLTTPSDLQIDSFNAKNKLDVLSAFVLSLNESEKYSFSEADWFVFCRNYRDGTLSYFDDRHLLGLLRTSRVFVQFGDRMYFKYSFFSNSFWGDKLRFVRHF